MIPRNEISLVVDVVQALVLKYGHPDEIPMGSLAQKGVNAVTAEKCEALLTSEDFPSDPGAATAKWLRLIGDYSK